MNLPKTLTIHIDHDEHDYLLLDETGAGRIDFDGMVLAPKSDADLLPELVRRYNEHDALREQVATLKSERYHAALLDDVARMTEQVATLTEERDEARASRAHWAGEAERRIRDHNKDLLALSERGDGLRADVERLTKERDEHQFYREQGAEDRDELTTQCARHLAAIETLLPILERVDEAQSLNYEDANRCIYKCGGYDLVKAAKAATANYAKKADKVVAPVVADFCGGCGETDGDKRCLGCHHPVEMKDVADRDDSRPDGDS